jgi:hypothetical protein
MSLILMMLSLNGWEAPAAEAPVCEPPPKKTITVPCDPHEGCEEKWIFIDEELPIS